MNTSVNTGLMSKYGIIGIPEVDQKVAVDVVSGLMNISLEFIDEDGEFNSFHAHDDIIELSYTEKNKPITATIQAPNRDAAITAIKSLLLQNAIFATIDYPNATFSMINIE